TSMSEVSTFQHPGQHPSAEQQSISNTSLGDAEEIFKLLVSAVQDYAIFALDSQGRILTWNAGAERLKGYSAQEIIGGHFSRFYTHEDIARNHPKQVLELAASQGKYEEEGWRLRKDGSKFWASLVLTALKDSSGKLRGFAKVTRDLTERKQSEEALRKSHDELESKVAQRTSALRQSEKQLEDVLESTADGFIALDKNFTVIRVNRNQERISGLSRDKTIGRNHWEIWPKENTPKMWEACQRVIHERVPVRIEEYNAQLRLWIAVDAYPTPDGGIAAFFRDITQHKAALTSLEMERERFSRFAAASGLGVWYCDLPFADLIWDRTVKEHFWLSSQDHVTIDTFYDRIHPADREPTKRAIEGSITGRGTYDVEYRTTNPKDPSQFKWIRAIGWTDYDISGNPIRFDGITFDITERKSASAQLQQLYSEKDELNKLLTLERAQLQSVVEHMPSGLVIIDPKTNEIILANRRAEEIWGRAIPTSTERYSLQAFHIDTDAPFQIEDWPSVRALKSKKPVLFQEIKIIRGDGSIGYIQNGAAPILNQDGEVSFVIVTMEDITPQKAAELEVRKAVRIRDEFLSIASHELKTPLTGMKMQAQLFSRIMAKDPHAATTPARVQQLADQMDRGLDRLARLIDDMLDVSRIQNGKLHVRLEKEDIAIVTLEALDRLRPQLLSAGIELTADLSPGLRCEIDRFRYEQVLTNLASNVMRYAPQAPVSVTLVAEDGRAVLRFQDRGPGIDRADQEKVFMRFERLSSAERVSGMGLGLYICRQIIESMHGSIRVESERNQGACFVIELPLRSSC
ncbi:MAG: PAS domain S-box protein, partial [Bdellovibrionia bacterium]